MSEWKTVNISEKAEIIMGQSPKSSDCNEEGIGIPFYQGNTDFGNIYPSPSRYCTKPKKIANKNDILLSVRAPVGEVNLANEKVVIGRGVSAIRPKDYDYLFLYYYLKNYKNNWLRLQQGSTFTAINKNDMNSILVPDINTQEQQKIAAILTTVDEAIEKTEQIIVQTETVKKGLMQQLLKKGIGHTEFKKTIIGEIPESWEVIQFKEIIDFLTDYEANGSFSDLKENVTVYDEPSYAYYVRATDLEKRDYISNVKYVDKESYDFLKKTKLSGGELLFAKRGQIGKLYIMPELEIKSTLAPNLYLIKIYTKVANNKFYYYFFKSALGQKLLYRNSASTTLGAIYKDDIRAINIILPPIKEQEEIVTILESLDEKITQEVTKNKNLKKLKQGLMQQLLTGKVRVPIDKKEEVLS
ncbi:hypothetical protein OBCHQ24_04850 [Oceanobacillus iheyensis]|nr:hypothetical protein OBCHQ24_04850 [Oceanobacillus iheyensis]